jgi:hypothetical protein
MPNPKALPTVKVELQVEPSGELISGRMTHDVTDLRPSSPMDGLMVSQTCEL